MRKHAKAKPKKQLDLFLDRPPDIDEMLEKENKQINKLLNEMQEKDKVAFAAIDEMAKKDSEKINAVLNSLTEKHR